MCLVVGALVWMMVTSQERTATMLLFQFCEDCGVALRPPGRRCYVCQAVGGQTPRRPRRKQALSGPAKRTRR